VAGLDAERGLESAPESSTMAADRVGSSMMLAEPSSIGKCQLNPLFAMNRSLLDCSLRLFLIMEEGP